MYSSLVLVDVATGVVREVNNYDDNNAQTLSFAIHYDCHMLETVIVEIWKDDHLWVLLVGYRFFFIPEWNVLHGEKIEYSTLSWRESTATIKNVSRRISIIRTTRK